MDVPFFITWGIRYLKMKRHAKVTHKVNNEIHEAFVQYSDDELTSLSASDKIYVRCKKLGYESPVYLIETGSGQVLYNEKLY